MSSYEFSFSLAAFVICEEDPTSGVIQIFKSHGFDPEQFEFKSTLLWKEAGDSLVELRDALKHFIHRNCKISVCVVDEDKRLGPAALMLLSASLKHPQLAGGQHRVFFDQGLFSSEKKRLSLQQATILCKTVTSHSNRILKVCLEFN